MKITNETKVGALTAISITLLILGYSFLKGNDLFSSDNKFYAKYDKVDGLTVSKPVMINGFQIGRVSKMELQPDGSTRVEFKIKPQYDIPKNTVASLESTDLLGGKAIVFVLGDDKTIAEDGAVLQSTMEKGLSEKIAPLQRKAEQLMTKFDTVLLNINTIMNKDFQHNVDRSFKSIANSLETLEGTTKKVDNLVGSQSERISAIMANAESISANLKNNNQTLTHIMTNFDQVSSGLAKANIQETMENANKAVAELQAAIGKVNSGQGSLGQLLNDDKLYNNLESASKNLDALFIDLKAHPKRYVSFSVFGGNKD
ncbi:MAG: MCE family protein [Mucilaginibacter polytrichastri]|nr:MCE family protein [Mucilaginibacter polytrichastri]